MNYWLLAIFMVFGTYSLSMHFNQYNELEPCMYPVRDFQEIRKPGPKGVASTLKPIETRTEAKKRKTKKAFQSVDPSLRPTTSANDIDDVFARMEQEIKNRKK